MFNVTTSSSDRQAETTGSSFFTPFSFSNPSVPVCSTSENTAVTTSGVNPSHVQFGHHAELYKSNTGNVFGTLQSSDTTSLPGINWTSFGGQNKSPFSTSTTTINPQNKQFFPSSSIATSVQNKSFFSVPVNISSSQNKSFFPISGIITSGIQNKSFSFPVCSSSSVSSTSKVYLQTFSDKPELKSIFTLSRNAQEQKLGTENPLVKQGTFSFMKAYQNTKQDSLFQKNNNIEKQEKFDGKKIAVSPKKRDTESMRYSSKQVGRLFGRALAGVKTTLKKLSPELDRQSSLQHKVNRRHSRSDSLTEDRRIASQEEILQITSIVCKGIPDHLNNKTILLDHFSQFGEIQRITCNRKKEYSLIYFSNHESAANAKRNGTKIYPDYEPIEIFWAQQNPSRKQDEYLSKRSEVENELLSMVEGIEDRKSFDDLEETESEKADFHIAKSEEELLALLATAALTPVDCYHRLDARDKLLRLYQQKTSDLAKAKVIVGTCPDMCPEKERYNRAEKNCLSIFEMKPDKTIDHKAAVKEYSRSSADQEEPLPHELRPPSVLMKTMDYLLCNVIDLMEGNQITGFAVGEWYDFIWNRTRAIRKIEDQLEYLSNKNQIISLIYQLLIMDITQQHLCSLESVSLIEKCTRFHIHCSEVLCEEDIVIFDVKINNENMTKCLQTLKHLYHDLDIQGVKCRYESEFRMYDVLLNLNEGDILREIQQFPPNIRESEELKFAISVFNAVNSNNYVKFFRLIKQTSYLNACLLHRYFSQIRIKAIHAMLKAYCIPNRPEQFPLLDLVHILAFENISEAKEFCQWFSLKSDDSYVFLNRGDFVLPATPPPVTRAYKLIESKRVTSIGEIINRAELPENPYVEYQPHNSFDEHGKLTKDAFSALDQAKKCKLMLSAEGESIATTYKTTKEIPNALIFEICHPCDEKQQIQHSLETVSDEMLKDVTCELTDEVITTIVENDLEWEVFLGYTSNDIFNSIFTNSCEEFLKDITADVLLTEKLEKQALLETKKREQMMEEECSDIVKEVTLCEINDITREVYRNAKQDWIEAIGQNVYRGIHHEVLQLEIMSAASQVHAEEFLARENELKAIQEEVELIRIRKAIYRWRQLHAQRCHLDYARKIFPSAPPLIVKCYSTSPNKKNICNFTKSLQLKNISDSEIYDHQLKELVHLQPLNLADILCHLLACNSINNISFPFHSFKLLLILPSDDLNKTLKIKKWFLAKFGNSGNNDNVKQDDIQLINVSYNKAPNEQNILLCIKAIDKEIEEPLIITLAKNRELMGTHAFLIVIPFYRSTFQKILEDEKQKLIKLLKCKQPIPAIPVQIFMIQCDDWEFSEQFIHTVADCLSLVNLKAKNLILDWNIIVLKNTNSSNADLKLLDAVRWLGEKSPIDPCLKPSYLKDFLEDGITKFVFNIVYSDLAEREKCDIYYQCPRAIISLYTAVINHMINTINSPYLQNLSWPVSEIYHLEIVKKYPPLHWNSPDHLRRLVEMIKLIQLKPFPVNLDSESEDDIWKYVSLVASNAKTEKLLLKNEIHQLLSNSRIMNNKKIIPWADILQTCSFFLFDKIDFTDHESNEELMIYYSEDEFNDFILPEQWIMPASESILLTESPTSKRKRLYSDDMNTKKPKLSPTRITSSLPLVDKVKEEVEGLRKELEVEKQTSKSFVTLLEKLVLEDIVNISEFSQNNQHSISDHFECNSPTETKDDILEDQDLETKLKVFKSKLEAEKNTNKLLKMKLMLLEQDDFGEIK